MGRLRWASVRFCMACRVGLSLWARTRATESPTLIIPMPPSAAAVATHRVELPFTPLAALNPAVAMSRGMRDSPAVSSSLTLSRHPPSKAWGYFDGSTPEDAQPPTPSATAIAEGCASTASSDFFFSGEQMLMWLETNAKGGACAVDSALAGPLHQDMVANFRTAPWLGQRRLWASIAQLLLGRIQRKPISEVEMPASQR